MKCPKCESEKTHSYDNQPLFHPSAQDLAKGSTMPFDNEVYVEFVCEDCGHKFTIVFDLVPRQEKTNKSHIKYCVTFTTKQKHKLSIPLVVPNQETEIEREVYTDHYSNFEEKEIAESYYKKVLERDDLFTSNFCEVIETTE